VGAAAAAVLALTGCQVDQLQFRNDHRLSFVAPGARDVVRTPLTISWTMKDFDAVGLDGSHDGHRGVYAVFVDRAPMPVGKDLRWLARGDRGCAHDPRCPDARYLADRGVHLTTDPQVTLDVLPLGASGAGDEQHWVNVVLLDGTGHRVGESAWYLPFRTTRRAA
jgi:hypothetical protein